MLGWPKSGKLALTFLWEYRVYHYKRLELAHTFWANPASPSHTCFGTISQKAAG